MMKCDRTQLTQRFEQALVYATQLHTRQYRKDERVPYLAHLLSVAALVLEQGGDEDEAIAALLHDAVEDQGGKKTRAEIQQRFGDRVTAIVDGCTELSTLPKPSWKDRKMTYLHQLQHASAAVRRVSLADKLHNARSLLALLHQEGTPIWTRFNGGREGTLWYYQSLNQIYQTTSSDYFSQEFERTISAIASFD
jgi:(p)ppGpp synthase/HD superfamily hydrolase